MFAASELPSASLLSRAIAAGKSLQEHAEEAGITLQTVRWRLKQVLGKTETHRQAELVRLLLATAASVPAGSVDPCGADEGHMSAIRQRTIPIAPAR